MGLLGEFRSGFEGFPLRIIRVVADNTAKELTLRQKYVDWGWFRKECQGLIDLCFQSKHQGYLNICQREPRWLIPSMCMQISSEYIGTVCLNRAAQTACMYPLFT